MRTVPMLLATGLILAGGLGIANPAFIKITRVEEADEAQATFPHWSHQEKYKCYTCHPSLFSMKEKKGFTHEEIDAGKACGACHDGETAFYPEDENHDCEECHVE